VRRVFGTPLRDYLPALVLFVLAALYLVTAYGYTPEARQFPLIVGWAALVLVAFDFVSRTRTPIGEAITRWFNPSTSPGKADAQAAHATGKQVAAILWIAGFVILIVAIGFVLAIPLYVFAAMAIRGRRSLLLCAIVSAAAVLFVYLTFVWLLELELYPGMVFGGF
jgi:Tripartite tricarboxylate transporter TctB family